RLAALVLHQRGGELRESLPQIPLALHGGRLPEILEGLVRPEELSRGQQPRALLEQVAPDRGLERRLHPRQNTAKPAVRLVASSPRGPRAYRRLRGRAHLDPGGGTR